MKRTFLPFLVLACLAAPALAQPLGFGLIGGARLTDFTHTGTGVTSQDHVYTLGPYAEFRLPLGFSLEGDLLYQKSGSTITSAATSLLNLRQFNIDSFEIPILVKKKFGAKAVLFHPYVEAGLDNRYANGLPGATPVSSAASGWQEGLVIGGGVELNIKIIRVAAELRWSRFGNISAATIPQINANQAQLLIHIGI